MAYVGGEYRTLQGVPKAGQYCAKLDALERRGESPLAHSEQKMYLRRNG